MASISTHLESCETCPLGKQHRTKFPSKADGPRLVRKNERKVEPNIFLSIDDKTHYVLCRKDQVFEKFREGKTMIEKSTGRRLKNLLWEFTSKEFELHLIAEGIRHELTIPNNPEQNGVAKRINWTLVETVRSMFVAEASSTATFLRKPCQGCIWDDSLWSLVRKKKNASWST